MDFDPNSAQHFTIEMMDTTMPDSSGQLKARKANKQFAMDFYAMYKLAPTIGHSLCINSCGDL